MDNRGENQRKKNMSDQKHGQGSSQSSGRGQRRAQAMHEGEPGSSLHQNQPSHSVQRGRRLQPQETEFRSSEQAWRSEPQQAYRSEPQQSYQSQPRQADQHREHSGPRHQERGRGRGRGRGQSPQSWQSQPQHAYQQPRRYFSPKQEPATTPLRRPEPADDFPAFQPSQSVALAASSHKPKRKGQKKDTPSGKESEMKMVESGFKELKMEEETKSVPPPTTSKELSPDTKIECKYTIPHRKSGYIQHSDKYVVGKPKTVEVNYLRLTFHKPDLNVYHYDCSFNPDGTPKYLLRPAFEVLRKKHFGDRYPSFDGKKNLFAGGSPLPFPNGDTLRDTIEVTTDNNEKKSIEITIKLVSHDLTLSKIMQYIRNGASQAIPQDVVQSVDVAMRSRLSCQFTPVGRSLFRKPKNDIDLGDGFVLWKGMFQSMIMAKEAVFLNVDVANKAFPRWQSILDFLKYDCNCTDENLNRGLPDYMRSQLSDFIRGLKIEYCTPPNETIKRTYAIKGLGYDAHKTTFSLGEDGPEISIFNYFKKEKRITLKYPNLPVLHVNNKKNTMLPLEFCYVKDGQAVMRKCNSNQTRAMIKETATSTDVRKRTIMSHVIDAQHNSDPALREFQVDVSQRFESVDAILLKEPSIQYKQQIARVKNGVWSALQFIESPGLTHWAILTVDDRLDRRDTQNLIRNLTEGGRELGIPVSPPLAERKVGNRYPREQDIEKELKKLSQEVPALQIVVVIMSQRPADLYNSIKRASELKTGVLTQCLKSFTVQKKLSVMTAKNILMKINAKVHGINHTIAPGLKPKILDEPVMFVGADVTHPAPGADGSVSIAAVAASHDLLGFKYGMQYRLQPPKREMIEDLESIIKEQLRTFKIQTGRQPTKLIYYRDGVSEGQFSQVLNIELHALKTACSIVYPDNPPKVTFLVVQKRHHTRFFPNKRDGDGSRNNNVLAGTLVDSKITHPTELDFYLVSHQSIQGTAKPTKYHVLFDENGLGDEEVEVLTFYLCFMFARCTRSVSYPAPTYYAHLAAFRGKAYWDGQRIDFANLNREQTKNGTIVANIINRNPMYFV